MSDRLTGICDAVVDLLDSADEDSVFAERLEATRAVTSEVELATLDALSVLVMPSHSSRKRTSNGTYRRDVVVEILVRKRFSDDAEDDQDRYDEVVDLLESVDDWLAGAAQADLTLADGALAHYIEPGDGDAEGKIVDGLGVYVHWDHARTLRQITGTVRVAYYTDEAY